MRFLFSVVVRSLCILHFRQFPDSGKRKHFSGAGKPRGTGLGRGMEHLFGKLERGEADALARRRAGVRFDFPIHQRFPSGNIKGDRKSDLQVWKQGFAGTVAIDFWCADRVCTAFIPWTALWQGRAAI